MNQIYGRNEIIHKVVDKLQGEKIVVGGNKHNYKRKYHLKYSIPIVKKVINALLEVLTEIVEDGDEANFRGYFEIKPVYRKATRARDICNGTTIEVPPKYMPRAYFRRFMNDACKRLTERELGGTNNEADS